MLSVSVQLFTSAEGSTESKLWAGVPLGSLQLPLPVPAQLPSTGGILSGEAVKTDTSCSENVSFLLFLSDQILLKLLFVITIWKRMRGSKRAGRYQEGSEALISYKCAWNNFSLPIINSLESQSGSNVNVELLQCGC